MTLNELYEKAKTLVENGHGDAILVHSDSRSGISERCRMGDIETVDGWEGYDFYTDLEVGDKYVTFCEGN